MSTPMPDPRPSGSNPGPLPADVAEVAAHAMLDPAATKPAEPAVTVGIVTGVVVAALSLLAAFGVGITDNQSGAVVALVVALAGLAPIVSGWITRGKVIPLPPPVLDVDDRFQG